MKLVGLLLLVIPMMTSSVHSQGFVQPSPGKAVVHFVFDKGPNSSQTVLLFSGRTLLGEFPGGEYTVVTVEPGHHMFWVWEKEPVWINAELAPDRMYVVRVGEAPAANAFYPRVRPITDRSADFGRIKRMISQNPPFEVQRRSTPSDMERIRSIAEECLARYENGSNNQRQSIRISKDDDIRSGDFNVPLISH